MIYKQARDAFSKYWQEFKQAVPENELPCARFWTNHGFLSGFIDGIEDPRVKDYPLSCKYYANAREEGRKKALT